MAAGMYKSSRRRCETKTRATKAEHAILSFFPPQIYKERKRRAAFTWTGYGSILEPDPDGIFVCVCVFGLRDNLGSGTPVPRVPVLLTCLSAKMHCYLPTCWRAVIGG